MYDSQFHAFSDCMSAKHARTKSIMSFCSDVDTMMLIVQCYGFLLCCIVFISENFFKI